MPDENNTPVTRKDLAELEARVVETLGGLIHDTETKLLRAFFQYQEHAEIKFRKLTADVSNVNTAAELRLSNLENRVVEIERRLLLGNSQ